ncbi:hypothetical protein SPONL_1088 [uncultured Candidatus Thioglobus sp.]|nr:hypothetical protein SPONL_1088 [uncultured Candidatus Thioglobus sp.]
MGILYNNAMNNTPINKPIKTPCVGICKYNKENYCVGCKRSSNEISGWINYSDDLREAIMQDLEQREIQA